MAGRAQPVGRERVAELAQLGLRRPVAGSAPRRPRRRTPRGRSARPRRTRRRAGRAHVQRARRGSRARQRVPEAGRVGAARDEAGDLAAGLDQAVLAGCAPRCARASTSVLPGRTRATRPRPRAARSARLQARRRVSPNGGRRLDHGEPLRSGGRALARRAAGSGPAAPCATRATRSSGRSSSDPVAAQRTAERLRPCSHRRPGTRPRAPDRARPHVVAVAPERRPRTAEADLVELGDDELRSVAASASSAVSRVRAELGVRARDRPGRPPRRARAPGYAPSSVSPTSTAGSPLSKLLHAGLALGVAREDELASQQDSSGSRARAPSRSSRRARSPARSRRGRRGRRVGTRSSSSRTRSRSPRSPLPTPRATGSAHTCWSWTASGVHADASALKRMTPSSHPDPRPALLDLRARAPAKAVRVAHQRIDPELGLVCRRAGRDEQVEIRRARGAKPALSRLGDGRDGVDRLAGPVLSRPRQPARDRVPQLGHGALLADQHPRPGTQPSRRAKTPQPEPEGTTFAPAWQSADKPSLFGDAPRTGRGRGARRPRGRRARPGPPRRTRGSAPAAARRSAPRPGL